MYYICCPTVQGHFYFYDEEVKNILSKFKPALSGISSIVFRNKQQYFTYKTPEANKKYYREQIAPFKGELELWYCQNQSIIFDILLIIVTISSLLFPASNLLNYFFDLPKHRLFTRG